VKYADEIVLLAKEAAVLKYMVVRPKKEEEKKGERRLTELAVSFIILQWNCL
jgi:hypothetical protein